MADFRDYNDTPSDNSGFIQIAGQVTMSAIVILFMIVVFFFFLHIFARKYWWRDEDHHHQRFESSRAALAGGQAANVVVTMREGLDKSILDSLPVVVFISEEFKDGLECSVCLSEVVDGEKARLLPKCNHGFHVDCIDMWFQSHSTCPLCRNPVSSPLRLSGLSESEATATIDNTGVPTVMMAGNSSGSSSFPILSRAHSVQQSQVDDDGPSYTVIDIPMEVSTEIFLSEDRCSDEAKSSPPVLTRMQTFKRLLSRENRPVVTSPRSLEC